MQCQCRWRSNRKAVGSIEHSERPALPSPPGWRDWPGSLLGLGLRTAASARVMAANHPTNFAHLKQYDEQLVRLGLLAEHGSPWAAQDEAARRTKTVAASIDDSGNAIPISEIAHTARANEVRRRLAIVTDDTRTDSRSVNPTGAPLQALFRTPRIGRAHVPCGVQESLRCAARVRVP
jgi:hypothetical protein